jgi:putative nucleotidyltransferase with HDIG domain
VLRFSENDKLAELTQHPLLKQIGQIADREHAEVYVVGGVVRDALLGRQLGELDFVVVGDGIAFSQAVAKALNAEQPTVYRNFGTAMLHHDGRKLEFVGARRESYRSDSRKPDVKPADLQADLSRRDFTINALAMALNHAEYGKLIDPFNGVEDLRNGIIRTPLEPEITFSDDPLRIMRGIRFATVFNFKIEEKTLTGMRVSAERLHIISQERITDEFIKILAADKPSIGFQLMYETGVLAIIFPEFLELRGAEERKGYMHKDVFNHTLMVVDNAAAMSQKLPLRFAALVHDIAKPRTKEFTQGKGWSFHGHEDLGARMLPRIAGRMKLPTEWLLYAQKLTRLHLRPIALTEEKVTDSAYRRLLFEAGEDLEDLLTLCRADITSGNAKRRQRHLANFDFVVQRLNEVEAKDKMRAFQSPVRGDEIMAVCGLTPGPAVGKLKTAIEEAILDGKIPNEHDAALAYLIMIKDEILRASQTTGQSVTKID